MRIGNGAYDQFQLDVLGEFAAVLALYAKTAGKLGEIGVNAFRAVAKRVAEVWQVPDHGLWEMRGPTRPFTASKVAAWTAIDRWIRVIDEFSSRRTRPPGEAAADDLR